MSKDKKVIGFSRNVFVLGLVSLFMDISSEMIYPLVPLFLSSVLGVSKTYIGLIEGIAESTASIVKVFSGWFSDRIKKRKILILSGYGLSTLSRPILSLAGSWVSVLIYRFTDRFGKGIRTAPRDAVVADSTEPSYLGRAFGFHRTMDTIGAAIGPAVAFFVLGVFAGDFRKVFWLSMVPGTIAVLLIIFFVKETVGKTHTSRYKDTPRLSLKGLDIRFRHFLLVATIFSLGNSSDAFLVLRARDFGIETVKIPLLYLTFNVVYSIVSIPAGMIADKVGKRRMIILGYLLFAFIYLGFAFAKTAGHIWFLFALYGVFMGISEGVQRAFVATTIRPELRATGYGIYHTAVGLAAFPASIIGGALWQYYGPHAIFLYGTATAVISSLLFIALLARE